LQGIVSEPIVGLARVAQEVGQKNDLSIRAESGSDDEIGVLISRFNQMLNRIQENDHALRISEQRFRQVTESIREVFWMTDAQKEQMIYISPGYEEIWGRPREKLYKSPQDWTESIHPLDRVRVMTAVAKQASGNYEETYRITRPDGVVRWIHDRAFPIQDEAGKVYRVTGIAEDITERKMAEQRLATQYAVVRALADSATLQDGASRILRASCECLGWATGAVWRVDAGSNLLRCVEAWTAPEAKLERFAQLSREKTFSRGEGIPGRVWLENKAIWIPDVLSEPNFPRKLAVEAMGLHAAFGIPISTDGKLVGVIEFFSQESYKLDNALLEMMTVLGDQIGQFMARKQSEEAVRAAEAKYRSIFENATEGIFQSTPSGRYLSVNPAMALMLGYASPSELIEQVSDIGRQICVDQESRPILLRRLEAEGSVKAFQTQVYRKDRTKIWVSINAHCIRDIQGAVLYYEGSAQDITARREAEAKLATLAHAVESTGEMISITDGDDRFTFVNQAFLDAYGYKENEVLGRTPQLVQTGANQARLAEEIFKQTLGGGWHGEILNRRKNGQEFPIALSTSPIKSPNGALLGLIGVATDISDRKRTEKQADAFSWLNYRLSAADTPVQAAELILLTASELFGWDAGYVHLFSPGTNQIVPVLTMDTIEGKRVAVSSDEFTLDPSPLMREIMERGARLIDRDEHPLTTVPTPFGDKARLSAAMMYVPIHAAGVVQGILSIQSYSRTAYTQSDLVLLQALADQCGGALQRIKVAEALKEAEASYRSIFENVTEGIFRTTPDGRFLSANPAMAGMFGYASAEELLKTISDAETGTYANATDRQRLKELLESQDSVHDFEAERVRRDGTKFWMSINAHAVRDAQGVIRYYEGTSHDVTNRKRATAVLRESEEKFRTLFESAPIGIALHGPDGHFVHTNSAYQRMLGYSDEELRRIGIRKLTHAEDIPQGQHLFAELRDGKRDVYQREKRYVHKDGRVVWGESLASAIRSPEGQLIYIISMVEDITARKQTLEALRESERNLRLIAENTSDVIFAFDMKHRPMYVNAALEAFTGYTFAELQARDFMSWVHPDDQERMLQHWNELYQGKSYSEIEFRLVTKWGEVRWCSSSWGPLLDEDGKQIGVQGRERDVSERKRLEREVLECSANERRRIGHDLHDGLGQYLAGIAFRAKALEQTLAAGHAGHAREARELATLLSSAINHARSLARGLDPVNVETVGLPAALQNLAAETQKFFDVPCTLRCADHASDIDPQAALALYRITQEAIHNAMTHGEATFIEIELSQDKSMVKLMVRDNGCGFEAKPEGQGMGLRVMQYRARSLGGTLEVQSSKDAGTEITCVLPSENYAPADALTAHSGKVPIRS